MSSVHKFKIPGLKTKVLLEPPAMAWAVKQAILDFKPGCEAASQVEVSDESNLAVWALSRSTDQGGAQVRFPIRPIFGWGAYGSHAGVRVEKSGEVVLIGDFWGLGQDWVSSLFSFDVLTGGATTFSQGSDGHKFLMALQRRLLQVEISEALQISRDAALELMDEYGITRFNEGQVEQFRIALLLADEFYLTFERAMEAASRLHIRSEAGIEQLRQQLVTGEMPLPALKLESIVHLAQQLGFTVDREDLILVPELADIPEATISGTRRLSSGDIQIVIEPVEVEIEDPVTGKPTRIQAWNLIGNQTSLSDPRVERLQAFCVGLATLEALVQELAADSGAEIRAGQDETGKIHMALVEKIKADPTAVAERTGLSRKALQAVANLVWQ